MKENAAKIIVKGFLKGLFDVFDAMLSIPFEHAPSDILEVNATQVKDMLSRCPVVFQGRIKSGLGAAVVLLSVPTAVRIASIILESDPNKPALDNDDLATLKEVADPAMGGGVSNLMERFGRGVEQLDAVAVSNPGPSGADAIMALTGPTPTAALFTFNAGADFSGEGALIYSASLEDLVPPALLAKGLPEDNASATLSPEEVSDILSGFTGETAAPVVESAIPETPGNLDMVLDIRLEATARLGRVEMPIAEILNLGPGSIIEVGHLVDEPVELLINDKLIARGDVVVVDEKFGLRITEIVSARARIESLR